MRVAGLPWLALAGCIDAGEVVLVSPTAAPPTEATTARVDALLDRMDLSDRIAQMHGSSVIPLDGLWPTPDLDDPDVPGFRMTDGPRGPTAEVSTVFPVGIARAATWDPVLETSVGQTMAREARQHGATTLLAPVANLAVDPRYGRGQETYGEDLTLVGEMATAFTQGVQSEGVMATAKHFALNHIEDTRFEVDMQVDPRTLREVYLPAFEQVVVDGGVASVMSAYNKVNGAYCGENGPLLNGILKDDWGFAGPVMSDWLAGTHDAQRSAEGGLDLEMPIPKVYEFLPGLVEDGTVDPAVVEESARRVLRAKVAFGVVDPPEPSTDDVVRSEAHLDLARTVARDGIVLLRNDGLLPLTTGGTVAVAGSLASLVNTGDKGSSDVPSEGVVTPLAGLRDAFGEASVTYVADDATDPALADADVAVVVVGFTWEEEGEKLGETIGGDRVDLFLPDDQAALVADVVRANPATVVVLEGGGAIALGPAFDDVPAVLHAWYPGQEGGAALADLLLGVVSPSGRMPQGTPAAVADLPPFDTTSLAVTPPRFPGYRHLQRTGTAATFPFGYGLTYGEVRYDTLTTEGRIAGPDDVVEVTVAVAHTAGPEVREVVQLYVAPDDPERLDLPPRMLVDFAKVRLAPGAAETVTLTLDARDLATWDETVGAFVLRSGRWRVEVGPDVDHTPLEAPLIVRVP